MVPDKEAVPAPEEEVVPATEQEVMPALDEEAVPASEEEVAPVLEEVAAPEKKAAPTQQEEAVPVERTAPGEPCNGQDVESPPTSPLASRTACEPRTEQSPRPGLTYMREDSISSGRRGIHGSHCRVRMP